MKDFSNKTNLYIYHPKKTFIIYHTHLVVQSISLKTPFIESTSIFYIGTLCLNISCILYINIKILNI